MVSRPRDTRPHDDVIKRKNFPRYWQFVRGIHRGPVNSPHKGQWRGALMFSLICTRINGWVNNGEAGDLRHHRAHYDITEMLWEGMLPLSQQRPRTARKKKYLVCVLQSTTMQCDATVLRLEGSELFYQQTEDRCRWVGSQPINWIIITWHSYILIPY